MNDELWTGDEPPPNVGGERGWGAIVVVIFPTALPKASSGA